MADKEKRKAIMEAHRKNADIIILQETHSSKECESLWTNEWGGDIIFNHGTSAARGVAILLPKGKMRDVKNVYKSEDGRVIVFDLWDSDCLITIAAIYVPNSDTPQFFSSLREILRTRQEHKIIVGDFNLTLEVELDRKNTYNNNNRSLVVIEDIIDEFKLVDVWRVQNGDKREYSWFKAGNINKASRLDFALVSAGIDQRVKSPTYLAGVLSDHRPLYFLVELDQNERGSGYWKFNTSYLQNISFVQEMNIELECINKLVEEKCPLEAWETMKKRIKKKAVEFARKHTSEEKIIIANLCEKVNEYQAKLPLDHAQQELYENTKLDLEEKLLEQAKAMLFRSKARWHELGEKNTKYFFNLEKTRYNAKTCFKLIDSEENEIVETQRILNYQKDFYGKLYQEDINVKFNLTNSTLVTVPEEVKQMQELQITKEDLERAIKGMANGKTPGFDGIPVDFYKVFWAKMCPMFCSMCEEVYKKEIMHPTARQGILNLIPKPGKDSRYIKKFETNNIVKY